eukprot:augustus_masked-scaffold_9-processed-gene-4.48-mRNA-1 protein AED:1.00 eAED:1.00 QI:0/-1/0/0/-1/1/1/0/333
MKKVLHKKTDSALGSVFTGSPFPSPLQSVDTTKGNPIRKRSFARRKLSFGSAKGTLTGESVLQRRCVENCSFLLRDTRLQQMCSPVPALSFVLPVSFRIHKQSRAYTKADFLLQDGSIRLLKHGTDHILTQVEIYNVNYLGYSGQQKKYFSVSAFETQRKKTDPKELPSVKNIEIEIHARTEDEAKRLVLFLLVELERVGDLVSDCLSNLGKLFEKNGKLKKEFLPHKECLLRRRANLYEICKLKTSTKLDGAKRKLAVHLQELGDEHAAENEFQKLETYSYERKKVAQYTDLESILLSTEAKDEVTILKQEISLISKQVETNIIRQWKEAET